MNQFFFRAKRRLLVILFVLLILVFIAPQANAGSYPSDMTTRYAGMLKPQNNLVDYDGNVNSAYSTVYLGNYLGGGEGSGSHPGVDIQDGDCALTVVRAVAEGTIIRVISNWKDQYPDRNPCGNNSDLGGWGNIVVILHDPAPARGEYSDASYTAYAHLWNVSADVVAGNKVLRGAVLGLQGSTGGSTGPHLHFQMDKETASFHPWWPAGLDVNSTAWQGQVRQNTFNPMRFVQAHLVSTLFLPPGASAQYFDEQGVLRGQFHETKVDHEWFFGHPPVYNIFDDNFSAQWDGIIELPSRGYWMFYVSADDGAQLWLDGELLLNEWNTRARPATFEVRRFLYEGYHSVSLRYFENTGYATIQFAWQAYPKLNLPMIIKNW